MNCKLYLSGFPQGWAKEQIETFINDKFSEYGEITSSVQYSPSELKFFAFVNYQTLGEAVKAKEALDDFQFSENSRKKLYINYAKDKEHSKRAKKASLFVKSIKADTKESDVKEIFSNFGTVTSASLKSKTIKFQGADKQVCLCFINFASPEEASAAHAAAKSDPRVLEIIDEEILSADPNFIFFSRDKNTRRKIPQAILQKYVTHFYAILRRIFHPEILLIVPVFSSKFHQKKFERYFYLRRKFIRKN